MNVLVVRGYPRKSGYTNYITELFMEGLKSSSAHIVDIDLTSQSIHSCIGCYHCWIREPGVCIHRDDMTNILQHFLSADIIVNCTPLYFYSMSSYVKIFWERTLPLSRQGIQAADGGFVRNNLRYPGRWPKKMIALVAGAFRSMRNFEPVIATFKCIADGMHLENAGIIVRPESYLLQFNFAKPKTSKMIHNALVQAGLECGRTGCISRDTIDKAQLPLAPSLELFEKYSNIYWEHVDALGEDAGDLDKVRKLVTADVRILMHEMARSIDPVATARLKARLQFSFIDKDLHFLIVVDRGKCQLTCEKASHADLEVRCTTATWASVFLREINVKDALVTKAIALWGDKSLFTRLDRFFPPPDA
ncbi:MAG: hypothetical protein GF398_05265 [Chitinivibrionales bacterium]|nr:hypothetical protein [Chitinivibrionales bacterium]